MYLHVFTDNLSKLRNNRVRIVRVYSNEIESIVHPHPRDVFTSNQFKFDSVISNYSSASLHNLARSSGFPHSKSLTVSTRYYFHSMLCFVCLAMYFCMESIRGGMLSLMRRTGGGGGGFSIEEMFSSRCHRCNNNAF